MPIKITGKGIDLGKSLREYTQKKVEDITYKYIGDVLDSHVTVGRDNKLFEVEVCLPLYRGFVIKTNGFSDDPYCAVDVALEKLEEKIRKHKRRIKDKERRAQWEDGILHSTKYTMRRKEVAAEDDEEHLIIAEQEGFILSLNVSEAVMKLDLTEVPIVMFKNVDSGRINAVYKRPDGHIGWIDYKLT
ncbi:MAG: ribosome-associated translation inhibitor RaiA [Holosporales bacterium]|nr:ribosome-associated translation inhibitor RaiA [Holosporales bacterium]